MSYVHRQSLVSASFLSFDCAACGILVPQPKIKPLGVPPAVEMRSLNHWTAREKGKVKSLSRVRLFLTPGTVACQAPQSRGFSRQEYCNGLPFPSPGDLPDQVKYIIYDFHLVVRSSQNICHIKGAWIG